MGRRPKTITEAVIASQPAASGPFVKGQRHDTVASLLVKLKLRLVASAGSPTAHIAWFGVGPAGCSHQLLGPLFYLNG
jgi:hypothetical protein